MNREKYEKAFMEILEITADKLPGLEYQGVPTWDSVGHMNLVGEIEDAFEIEMETDDVISFSSFEKGIEILKKYGVEI